MNSLVVNRYPYPSSLYKYALDLLDGNAGESSLLNLLTNSNKWSNAHAGQDVKVVMSGNFYLSGLMSRLTFRNARRIIGEYQKNHEKIVVHMVSPFADPSFAAGFPRTVTIHDSPEAMFVKGEYRRSLESSSSYSIRMRMNRMLYAKAMKLPYLCVNSKHVAAAMKEYGYDGQTFVLYPAISRTFNMIPDRLNIRKKLHLPVDRILLLSVSIDEVRKNLDMVKHVMSATKSWASVVRIGSDIGSGYTFKEIDDSTMNLVYNACDVLLMPSLEEGFGNPVVEAFKVGLPVVASDIEVFREVAGDAAVFVDPLNLDDILRGIHEALDHKDMIIAKAAKRVPLFELQAFSKRIKQMYDEISRKF
ncbi:MAG: glycosyltransferase [Thermoplasmatales archaeon]